jgi:hypothetical protein
MTVTLRTMHPTHQNQQTHNLPLKATARMQTKRKRNITVPNSKPHLLHERAKGERHRNGKARLRPRK